ncbi:hypothetical protein ACVWZA_000534 [Sphingomonas sp. UYAg733]
MQPDFQLGRPDIGTALVLACPGGRELEAGYPAAGQTGTNLDGMLRHLHEMSAGDFPSPSRHEYRIVNSVAFALYKSRDGRTMPRDCEVLAPANLERLSELLAHHPIIVTFSAVAELGVRAIGREPTYIFHHPSMSRLNTLYPRLGGTRPWRVEERYSRAARDLLGH